MSKTLFAAMKKVSIVSTSTTPAAVEMTKEQIARCKAKLRKEDRGYNVTANQFDLATPYRVSINYKNEWFNLGNFVSVDVAAAVGTLVATAVFGEKAKAGAYDEKLVDGNAEWVAWLADPRNAKIIAVTADPENNPSELDGGSVLVFKADRPLDDDNAPF